MGQASGSISELEEIPLSDAKSPLAGKRGLVLDDEFLIALDLEELLQGAGAEIVSVSSIDKAVRALREGGPWHFAILDRHLDGTTSTSVASACAGRNIPFVFLTGSRGPDRPGEPELAVPVIEKPYQPEALIETIRKLLDRR
ncbi:MAG: response regulator [Proteobacteria bacterium]|nr:response regulator [Pseudomonadota bacterium]